jgi:hypothetical protein
MGLTRRSLLGCLALGGLAVVNRNRLPNLRNQPKSRGEWEYRLEPHEMRSVKFEVDGSELKYTVSAESGHVRTWVSDTECEAEVAEGETQTVRCSVSEGTRSFVMSAYETEVPTELSVTVEVY